MSVFPRTRRMYERAQMFLWTTGRDEEARLSKNSGKKPMKNRNFTMFEFAFTVLLAGLISSLAWAAPAGKIVAWGGNEQGGQITGQLDAPPGNDFVAVDAGQGA